MRGTDVLVRSLTKYGEVHLAALSADRPAYDAGSPKTYAAEFSDC